MLIRILIKKHSLKGSFIHIYDCIFGKIDLNFTPGTKMLILELNV